MFKPRYLNVLAIVGLMGGIGFSSYMLATAKIEGPRISQKQEPVLPAWWSEPVWPTPDKLGNAPVATTLLAIPDWAARDPQNRVLIPRLKARFPDTQLLGLDLVQTIAEIQKASGVTIVVDWDELAKQGIKRDSPLSGSSYTSATLDGVLNEVFKRVYGVEGKLGYDICEGIIRVTTKEALDRRNLFTRVYNVADLVVAMDNAENIIYQKLQIVPPASQAGDPFSVKMAGLVNIIRECVLKDSWKSAGGAASIEPLRFTLVVAQTPEGHAHIERLLEQLRSIVRGN